MSDIVSSVDVLSDFDLFFYYGQNDLDLETKHDLMLNLMQPKRSLLGNRALDAAGIESYENTPVGMILAVMLPFDIASSIQKRNQHVSNGENGSRDRRTVVSQSTVRVEAKQGDVDITVLYIPLASHKPTTVTAPLGIGG